MRLVDAFHTDLLALKLLEGFERGIVGTNVNSLVQKIDAGGVVVEAEVPHGTK